LLNFDTIVVVAVVAVVAVDVLKLNFQKYCGKKMFDKLFRFPLLSLVNFSLESALFGFEFKTLALI